MQKPCHVNTAPHNEPSSLSGLDSPQPERAPSLIDMLARQVESQDRLTEIIAALIRQNQEILTLVVEVGPDDDPDAEPVCDLSGKPIVKR